MRNRTRFYIDGEWVEPSTGNTLEVTNPATEKVIGPVALGNEQDVDKAVAAARVAFDFLFANLAGGAGCIVGKHHRSLQGSFR